MRVTLYPILRELRALYDVQEAMPRFRAYVALMTAGPEFLPIGVFSPMGQRQTGFLDALLALGAEDIAAQACAGLEGAHPELPVALRLLLVVADEPRNGWTQRWLTDAEWRFQAKYDRLPAQHPAVGFDRWVTVQFWTDRPPSPGAVLSEVRGTVGRALWQWRHGLPVTLRQMLAQEEEAYRWARWAGPTNEPHQDEADPDDLAYTTEVLRPLLDSAHWPTLFAAIYGDEAARAVGFPPLGLSRLAGLALARSAAG